MPVVHPPCAGRNAVPQPRFTHDALPGCQLDFARTMASQGRFGPLDTRYALSRPRRRSLKTCYAIPGSPLHGRRCAGVDPPIDGPYANRFPGPHVLPCDTAHARSWVHRKPRTSRGRAQVERVACSLDPVLHTGRSDSGGPIFSVRCAIRGTSPVAGAQLRVLFLLLHHHEIGPDRAATRGQFLDVGVLALPAWPAAGQRRPIPSRKCFVHGQKSAHWPYVLCA